MSKPAFVLELSEAQLVLYRSKLGSLGFRSAKRINQAEGSPISVLAFRDRIN